MVRDEDSQAETDAGHIAALESEIDALRRRIADLQFDERIEHFAASSKGWFWETDAGHRFVYLSKSVQDVVGVPPEWHYGKTRDEIGAPESVSPTEWRDFLTTLNEHRPFRDFVFRRVGPTGAQWLQTSGTPMFAPDGTFLGYRGVATDITAEIKAQSRAAQLTMDLRARRRSELELSTAVDRLQSANVRLQELSRMLAHDLKSPIASVQGVLGALEAAEDETMSARAHEYVGMCIDTLGRLLEKISVTIQAAVDGEEDDAVVSTAEVLAAALADLGLDLKAHDIQVEVGPLPRVRGRASELRAVFQNLLSNAIKYRRPDATLVIAITADPPGEGFVRIHVQDNGRGIASEELPRVFDAGFRGAGYGHIEGSGQGLAFVQAAVRRLDGAISATSEPDKGACFMLDLRVA